MSFTYIWDASFEAAPTDNTYGYLIDDYFRTAWVAIRERMQIDHQWKNGQLDGQHTQITFSAPISTPAKATDVGYAYTKDVSGNLELHFLDELGNEVQLTSAGKLNGGALSLTAVLSAIYPVGSIYFTVSPTNPATTFGFGTWTAWGSGMVPVGVNVGDANFNTVEKTGGEETHLLTSAESGLPAHNHTIYGCHGGGGGPYPYIEYSPNNLNSATASNTAADAASAHNNLQPYITCYMWKRTA